MEVQIYENPFLSRGQVIKIQVERKPAIMVRDYYSYILMGGTGKVKFEDRLEDCFRIAENRVRVEIYKIIERGKQIEFNASHNITKVQPIDFHPLILK